MKKVLVFAIVVSVMWMSPPGVGAVDYYVDGTGGNNGNPGTINDPWETISQANSALQAGDMVYIRGGTYSGQHVNPNNSGADENNYITYVNYGGEEVIVNPASGQDGYFLENVNYIKIDGIRFEDMNYAYFGRLRNAEYCIIQNCEFYNSRSYGGTRVGWSSNYNKFLNNVFEDAPINYNFELTNCESLPYGPDCDCDTAPADFISIYSGIGNIIEGNIFGLASHGCINIEPRAYEPWGDSKSNFTVVRNNTFTNKYHTGACANCTALIEGNRCYDMGAKANENPRKASRDRGIAGGHPGIYVMSSNSIIRNNICDNNGRGIYFGAKSQGAYISEHERYYHNTLYRNHEQVWHSGNSGADYNDNILKNNICYNAQVREWSNIADYNYGANTENYFINNAFTPGASNFYFKNTNTIFRTLAECKSLYPLEWHSSNFSATPKFTNAANRDFTLQPSSPMIDRGVFLTTITGNTANSQTSFTLDDAGYFYDGWNIPGETGDTIKTQNGQITEIQSINYGTNTITVSPAINIVNGEGVALDYEGTPPDIGAFEYISSSTDITTPTFSNPYNFTLQQNYPNPFNPSTTIQYSVTKPSNVQIKIYNQLGQEVCVLVNERKPAGEHNVTWDGKDAKGNNLASGIYFYRLTAGKQIDTKKMLYLR